MMNYTLYTNLDASFSRPYERGDRLVKGYSGTVPGWDDVDAETQAALLATFAEDTDRYTEDIFRRHNRDDRPDGQTAPSLSVGDVVVLAETAWSVANLGFVRVDLDPADLITDRPYLEVIR